MTEVKIITGLVLLLGAAAILYYLWRRTVPELPPLELPSAKLPWYSPLFSNPFSRKRLQHLAIEHQHTQQHHHQQEFLLEHGLKPKEKVLSPELEKLHHIISQHQQSKLWQELSSGERNAFERLEELVTGIRKPQSPQKLSSRVTRLTSRQKQDIFSILRKISRKK